MRERRLALIAGGTALALLAPPACGDGGATLTTPPPDGPQPVPSGTAHAAVVRESDELEFAPATSSIHAGDVVEWRNSGTSPHNVTFDGYVQSSPMQGGESFRLRFPRAGTYAYVCTFHAGMAGTITVR